MKSKARLLPALLLAVMATVLAGCGTPPEEHLQRGKALFDKGDAQSAIVEFKNTLQAQPANGEARFLLGKAYIEMESFAEAEKELTRALEHNVGQDKVLPLLAKAKLRIGQLEELLALQIPPGSLDRRALAGIQTTRAEALWRQGKQSDRDQAIATAEQLDANHPELLLLKARIAQAMHQDSQATALLDAVLQQQPQFKDALYFKAVMLQAAGQDNEAIRVYQQILAASPKQFRASLALANLLLQTSDTQAAEKELQRSQSIAGNHPMVRYTRGLYELQKRNLEQANSAFMEVLKVLPNHTPSLLGYALTSYGLGNHEQSLKNAKMVLAAEPANVQAAKILAGSQMKLGDPRKALDILAPLLATHPQDANLLALTGEAHLLDKNYVKAMAYLDKAAEIAPRSAAIRSRQAAGQLATGQRGDAIANLESVAALGDTSGQTGMALVMLHLRQQEYDQALASLKVLEQKLPTNPVVHNLRAVALLGKKDIAAARNALEQALAVQSNFVPAAIALARLDMRDNQPEAARKRFESILATDQTNIKAMLALADLAAITKNDKEHVAWLEKVIKADSGNLAAYDGLIRHHLARNSAAKAMALAKQAVASNPSGFAVLNMLGATQMASGDFRAAIETFSRLTQVAPQSPDAYFQLALAHSVHNQPGKAREALESALEIKPDFLRAQEALIGLELSAKKPEAALALARRMQTQHPGLPTGFEREGDIHLTQKRYSQAIRSYEQAMAKKQDHSIFIKLNRTLHLAGDIKTAEQALSAWLQRYPGEPTIRDYAANYFVQTKRNREAVKQYEELLKIKPNSALAINNLALLYQKEKDPRALDTAERALKLAPEHPAVLDTIGWILVEQGQLPRALELLGKSVAKAGKVPSVRYHYGAALVRSGNKAEGKKEIAAALALKQDFPEKDEAKALLSTL